MQHHATNSEKDLSEKQVIAIPHLLSAKSAGETLPYSDTGVSATTPFTLNLSKGEEPVEERFMVRQACPEPVEGLTTNGKYPTLGLP